MLKHIHQSTVLTFRVFGLLVFGYFPLLGNIVPLPLPANFSVGVCLLLLCVSRLWCRCVCCGFVVVPRFLSSSHFLREFEEIEKLVEVYYLLFCVEGFIHG
jgi:hypothetical protein